MSRHQAIEALLRERLSPTHLTLENESHKHSVKPGSETHFKLVIVSDAFQGLGAVARQRKVNQALREMFDAGLHALTMHVATPAEWALSSDVLPSPDCQGSKKRPKEPATDA